MAAAAAAAAAATAAAEATTTYNGNNNNNNKNKHKNKQNKPNITERGASPSLVDTGACEKGVREDDSCKGGVSRGRGASGERLGSIVGGGGAAAAAAAAIVDGAGLQL